MSGYVTRREWGARYDDGEDAAPLPAREWWLHHSATAHPDDNPDAEQRAVRALEDIGESRFKAGISYSWCVMPSGRIYQGHSMGRRGTHTAGHNTAGRGICLVGDYTQVAPTEAQLGAVAWIMVSERLAGRAATHRLDGGHRDLKATECPGLLAYERIPDINCRADTLWEARHTLPVKPPKAAPPPALHVPPFPLPRGHYYGPAPGPRESVSNTVQPRQVWVDGLRAWQSRMRARGWAVPLTGIYDTETSRVVRAFQAEKGLTTDGLLGPSTWAAAWTAPIT